MTLLLDKVGFLALAAAADVVQDVVQNNDSPAACPESKPSPSSPCTLGGMMKAQAVATRRRPMDRVKAAKATAA